MVLNVLFIRAAGSLQRVWQLVNKWLHVVGWYDCTKGVRTMRDFCTVELSVVPLTFANAISSKDRYGVFQWLLDTGTTKPLSLSHKRPNGFKNDYRSGYAIIIIIIITVIIIIIIMKKARKYMLLHVFFTRLSE